MQWLLTRRAVVLTLAAVFAVAAMFVQVPSRASAAQLWQGTVLSAQANVRSAPSLSAPIVNVLNQGQPVTVVAWVQGTEAEPTVDTWAELGPGQYVYSMLLDTSVPKVAPPTPAGAGYSGKWIDVNLTDQVLTAYVGSTPVHSVLTSSGRPDYPTPVGTFTIIRRVANETMKSSSIPGMTDFYDLKNVLFTQYFTSGGAAIHEAWWKTTDSFGIPTSHGCLGLTYNNALWFWNWATVGTPVVVHR